MKDQFQRIFHFLKKYQRVHEIEYLRKYPNPYESFILPWIDELMEWSFIDLAEFESYPNDKFIKNEEFKSYINQIKDLTNLKIVEVEETKLAPEILRKLNPKKKHEVQTLRTIINQKSKSKTIIDIGGGAGYLSSALVVDSLKQSICVDMNSKLQETGLKKIDKWHPEIKDQIKFVRTFFKSNSRIPGDYNSAESSIIGLHSCGPLSTELIKFGVQNEIQEIISFGCCYHKINDEYNLSQTAKLNNLKFTNNALHLAGRSSAVVSELDLEKRFKIKSYRYALHYFLYDNFKLDFYSVGNSLPNDFKKPFSHYARKYHRGSELDSFSDDELNTFFESSKTQELIKKNFLADIIRMQLGRVIEVYLLMDRALYIKESGREAELTEVFNREISPRNIMIYAY